LALATVSTYAISRFGASHGSYAVPCDPIRLVRMVNQINWL